jgi:CopA family copper-resistance protein
MEQPPVTRRNLLGSLSAVVASSYLLPANAWTQVVGPTLPSSQVVPELHDANEFNLEVADYAFSVNGRIGKAIAINGSVPGPLVRLREGQDVTIHVHNRLKESTSIHWHGLILPQPMDGVPGVSFAGIPADSTFTYRFPVRQSGTYWAHSHSGAQELLGLYFPLIIDPIGPEPFPFDRDYTVVLSDWSFLAPGTIIAKLKKNAGYFNYEKRTPDNLFDDVGRNGFLSTIRERLSWAKMRMDPTDFADVTGFTYTYLLNGNTPDANWTGLFSAGERVRLRFIAAGAMTYFDVRIPGLKMTVVAADGQVIQPVEVDEFRIGAGETFDVLVEPANQPYTLFAEAMDRSGFARGTLAPRPGMSAPVPPQRQRPVRTMADMGMGGMEMGGMAMGKGAAQTGAPEIGSGDAGMAGMPMPTTSDAKNKRAPASAEAAMSGMAMGKDGSTQAVQSNAGAARAAAERQGGMDIAGKGMRGMDKLDKTRTALGEQRNSIMKMKPGTSFMPVDKGGIAAERGGLRGDVPSTLPGSPPVMHGLDTHGPGNSVAPMTVSNRLNDPGSGFDDPNSKVLVYTDLKSPNPQPDQREAARAIELHITGNMERYMWSFDGVKYSGAKTPISFVLGERLRMILVNDTMMEHPIHLHGMWMELENGAGPNRPRKHTISVKPAERLSVLITPDIAGRWVMHCHLLLHMDMGMLRVVEVSESGKATS